MTTRQITDTPLLDLDEPHPRHFVTLEGERHYMARQDDLPINARKRVGRLYNRVVALEQLERELEPAEEDEYATNVRALVSTVFPTLPAAAIEAMGQEQREGLATAFFSNRFSQQILRRLLEAIPESDESRSGVSSSPGSNASTASPTPGTG